MILPAAIVQSANGISGEINSYTNNLVSDILPQGYTQSDMANVPGMSQFNPFPSITTGAPIIDLSSQANDSKLIGVGHITLACLCHDRFYRTFHSDISASGKKGHCIENAGGYADVLLPETARA